MKIRDIVRTAVIKTNSYWPFSSLNKTPYYLAIRIFVEACRRFPEIRSVYLRSGLAEGHWLSGLSDIDLTVIIDSRLSTDAEFAFLCSFWKRYNLLKCFFPMLGEIEILNNQQLKTWTQFGLRGYEAPHWRLLYGAETLRSPYSGDSRRLTKDCLNDALSFYRGYFREKFTADEQCPYLISQELKRITAKIFRCLSSMNPIRSVNGKVLDANYDNVEMLHRILSCLEEDIARFNACEIPRSCDDDAAALESSKPVPHDDKLVNPTELSRLNGAIESVLRNYHGMIFVVLKAGLDRSKLRDCIEALQRSFPHEGPIILTRSLFTYMQRHYDPFDYGHLIRFREVLFGEDLVLKIQPPSRDSLIDYLLGQVPNILTFPRSCAVILSDSRTTSFLIRELARVVERALLLKLYLEKGVVQPWYNELLTECQQLYPEIYKKLRELKETDRSSRQWFSCLRSLSDEIHGRLRNPTGWEHPGTSLSA
jgi:hypothetical protein